MQAVGGGIATREHDVEGMIVEDNVGLMFDTH